MTLFGKAAHQIAEAAGLMPPKRRAVSTPVLWCWACDIYYSVPPTCPDHGTLPTSIRFGSLGEGAWYAGLRLQERAGQISGLRPHPVFTLPGNIRYTADAEWWAGDQHCIGEYKSKYTAKGREWRRTRKQFIALYPELTLVEVIE